jgi:uncharacterized protein YndB with AHSA1/START domain
MLPQIRFPIFPQPKQDGAPRGPLTQELTTDLLSARLEVSIHADIRRLFHALTDPEYLEAWITLPGCRPGCSIVAGKYDRDFLIEHFCDGRQSLLISGRYLVLRRRHVLFSWRVDGDLCVPDTIVEIRLCGDFERTTLTLRHSGFSTRHDSAWHRALWNNSISRLAHLYGTPDRLQSFAGREREPISLRENDRRQSEPRNGTNCN